MIDLLYLSACPLYIYSIHYNVVFFVLVFINCTDKPDVMLLIIINFYLYSLVVNSFSGRRFYLVLLVSVSCIESHHSVSCT